MSDLRILVIVSIITGIVVALTSCYSLAVPATYSIILGFAAVVTFFFVILSTRFIFYSRASSR